MCIAMLIYRGGQKNRNTSPKKPKMNMDLDQNQNQGPDSIQPLLRGG